MLTHEILQTLKAYTATMKNSVALVLQTGEHSKRGELVDFLNKLASVSPNLHFEERDCRGELRSPLSFKLEVGGKANGIVFSGIPGGHEFNSLVLAILHSSGTELKLDSSIKNIISAVDQPLKFEVFVSLSCHNCPDVVQAINQFAILNPNISSEMIDGGLYPALIAERNIQGVPCVYLNGKPFANGKIDTAQLLEKLIERFPQVSRSGTNVEKALPLQDVTIIGGGPSGIAAAIYAARKGLKVTLLADRFGGQVKDTLGIENLISVPRTTGPELSNSMRDHLNDYEITLKEHFKVDSITKGPIKKITLNNGETITSKSLIIATGAKWRELGIPGEKENIGNGVAYCPHCDGPFFKGKDVAVIGGGNSGVEAAIDLAGIVKSVTIYEFMTELKADNVLIKKAQAQPNITIKTNVATKEIIADNGKVVALEYLERSTGDIKRDNLSGVFVQIGLVPNSAFLNGEVEMSQHGEILIDERCATSEEGIFACGDVTNVPYKQIIIAMGEGAKASLSAFDYLIKNH